MRYRRQRLPERMAGRLACQEPPAWIYLQTRRLDLSSTEIRATAGNAASTRILEEPTIAKERAEPSRTDHAPSTPALEPTGAKKTRPAEKDADFSRRLRDLALDLLDDDKAEEVVEIPLAGRSAIADYMIVASGTSHRHVSAMADHLLEALKAAGAKGIGIEGQRAADWVLIDTGDVIVHLFRPEVREFYNLERLWVDSPADGEGSASAES